VLRIDKNGKKLVRLQKSALAEADHWERELQAMIMAAPDSFCEEIGERLWLIGQEVRPSEAVPDRIDILAIDETANSVIIELKRGTHKLQLLQAVSYAGMVSRWSSDRFVETLAANFSVSIDDARSEIEEHTGSEVSSINQSQRIILIAEDFDPALLVAAEWLHESFGVDIRCYRIQLSREENGDDYLTCTCIYPPIEIATLTRGSDSRPGRTASLWASWDVALESIENTALTDFVRAELARKQEERLSERQIIYRIGGQRRFYLNCRRKFAYVWQRGRFEGDLKRWHEVLSEPDSVKPVNNQRELRFYLKTPADFAAFAKAMRSDLTNAEFAEPVYEPTLDQL
jgi:hypothetical protein